MRVVLLLLLAMMAGCVDDSTPQVPLDSDGDGVSDEDEIAAGTDPFSPEVDAPAGQSRVVVAVLDTAINPYHVHFQRESLSDDMLEQFRDATTNETPERVWLAQNGTYDERREADAEFWGSVQAGKMYYFEGTNIIAVTHGSNIIDGGSHGTATSGAVLDGNPDAIIAFSQGFTALSENWASKQPWIDFMSESYGPLGSPPTWIVAGSNTADANRIKWNAGGIPVGASDNSPALAPVDSTAGPPWVVGVAGDHDDGCREPMSGNIPDFTADFTQTLPSDRTIDQYGSTSGTSFATPMTAGVFSKVLLDVRTAWNYTGGITDVQDGSGNWHKAMAVKSGAPEVLLRNIDLRHVMNMTATYNTPDGCGGVPVNPAAPWVQQGWGHIGPEIAEPAAECIILHFGHGASGPECRQKDAAAIAYMSAVHAERQATWGQT